MKETLLVMLALACMAYPGRAGERPLRSSPEETLRSENLFAFGGIGVAGTISTGETAFRAVLKQSDGAAVFRRLLHYATPDGQCYALLGLHRLDPDAFRAALPAYLENTAEIDTAAGCILMKLPAKNIVAEIRDGKYDRVFDVPPRGARSR